MFKKNDLKRFRNQGSIVFKSKLLKELTPFERYELLQLCHRRKFKEGEFVYHQNDPGTGIYFVEEGVVRLAASNNVESSETEIFTLDIDAPSEFGMLSVGYEIPRMTTAQAMTDSTLLGFFKPDFETLKKRNPETAVKFLEAVSTQTVERFEQAFKQLKKFTDIQTALSVLFHESQEFEDRDEY